MFFELFFLSNVCDIMEITTGGVWEHAMADYNWYLSEAEKNYAPARQSIQNQINAIGGQQETALGNLLNTYNQQTGDLNQRRDDYNRGTLNTANNRGLGWSNVASTYQADYNKNSYTPAMTNLTNNYNTSRDNTIENYTNRQFSLENTLNSLIDEQRKYAMSQWQAEQDREAQVRASQAAAAAQAAALSRYLGSGSSSSSGGSNGTYAAYGSAPVTDANGYWNSANQTYAANGKLWTWDDNANAWRLIGDAPSYINSQSAVHNGQNVGVKYSNNNGVNTWIADL
jgi:hypothetical protein